MTRLFFATDVHGSDVCWKKFISAGRSREADVLVLGGDMTGKAIVPLIHQGGEVYRVTFLGQTSTLKGEEAVAEMEETITNRGYYPYRTDPDQIGQLRAQAGRSDELFVELARKRIEEWMTYADEKLKGSGVRCYVCPGNDDTFEIDEVIAQAEQVQMVEGQVVALDDRHEMISTGWSNFTPWRTHRECEEEELTRQIEAMTSQVRDMKNCIFNIHAPAYGCGLDEALELDQNLRPRYPHSLASVGSQAVREAIEKHQPLLALFGHIHEGRGSTKIGRTRCLNPGSMYDRGVLMRALIQLDEKGGLKSYILTTG